MKRVLIIPGTIMAMAALVAMAIVFSSWRAERDAGVQSLGTQATPREQTFNAMLTTGTSAVYVEDQSAGTTEVAVGFAVMENAGFVAIYDSEGGHPGKEIGRSALLPAGGGEHLTVQTTTPLRDGQIYYAILLDANGRELADAEDNVILMSFSARADAEPETGAIQP